MAAAILPATAPVRAQDKPASLPNPPAAPSPVPDPVPVPRPGVAYRLALFQAMDEQAQPAPGGVVLVGSSMLDNWVGAVDQLAPLPIVNRAIGGSRTADQLDIIERTALRYRPNVIVYYCGANDITALRAPSEIAANVRRYAEEVHRALPHATMLYLAILRAPDKRILWPAVDEANRLVADYVAAHPARLRYIDLNPLVEAQPYQPRMELYRPDWVHYLPAAYDGFATALKPAIEAALAAANLTVTTTGDAS